MSADAWIFRSEIGTPGKPNHSIVNSLLKFQEYAPSASICNIRINGKTIRSNENTTLLFTINATPCGPYFQLEFCFAPDPKGPNLKLQEKWKQDRIIVQFHAYDEKDQNNMRPRTPEEYTHMTKRDPPAGPLDFSRQLYDVKYRLPQAGDEYLAGGKLPPPGRKASIFSWKSRGYVRMKSGGGVPAHCHQDLNRFLSVIEWLRDGIVEEQDGKKTMMERHPAIEVFSNEHAYLATCWWPNFTTIPSKIPHSFWQWMNVTDPRRPQAVFDIRGENGFETRAGYVDAALGSRVEEWYKVGRAVTHDVTRPPPTNDYEITSLAPLVRFPTPRYYLAHIVGSFLYEEQHLKRSLANWINGTHRCDIYIEQSQIAGTFTCLFLLDLKSSYRNGADAHAGHDLPQLEEPCDVVMALNGVEKTFTGRVVRIPYRHAHLARNVAVLAVLRPGEEAHITQTRTRALFHFGHHGTPTAQIVEAITTLMLTPEYDGSRLKELLLAHDLMIMAKNKLATPTDDLPRGWEARVQAKCAERNLNPQQFECVKSFFTNYITLVQGPPGTGKTTLIDTILELQEEFRSSTWVATESDAAVDILVNKVCNRKNTRQPGIDKLRIGPHYRDRFQRPIVRQQVGVAPPPPTPPQPPQYPPSARGSGSPAQGGGSPGSAAALVSRPRRASSSMSYHQMPSSTPAYGSGTGGIPGVTGFTGTYELFTVPETDQQASSTAMQPYVPSNIPPASAGISGESGNPSSAIQQWQPPHLRRHGPAPPDFVPPHLRNQYTSSSTIPGTIGDGHQSTFSASQPSGYTSPPQRLSGPTLPSLSRRSSTHTRSPSELISSSLGAMVPYSNVAPPSYAGGQTSSHMRSASGSVPSFLSGTVMSPPTGSIPAYTEPYPVMYPSSFIGPMPNYTSGAATQFSSGQIAGSHSRSSSGATPISDALVRTSSAYPESHSPSHSRSTSGAAPTFLTGSVMQYPAGYVFTFPESNSPTHSRSASGIDPTTGALVSVAPTPAFAGGYSGSHSRSASGTGARSQSSHHSARSSRQFREYRAAHETITEVLLSEGTTEQDMSLSHQINVRLDLLQHITANPGEAIYPQEAEHLQVLLTAYQSLHGIRLEDPTVEDFVEEEGRMERTYTRALLKLKQNYISSAKQVFSTLSATSDPSMIDFKPSAAIIDGASQPLEAKTVHALIHSGKDSRRILLVGDENQLPPTLVAPRNPFRDTTERSLFERLILANFPTIQLTTQYRMHPTISSIVNECTYGNLVNGPSTAIRPRTVQFQQFMQRFGPSGMRSTSSILVHPIQIPGIPYGSQKMFNSSSRYNLTTARMVYSMVNLLINGGGGFKAADIMVICFYTAQVNFTRALFQDTPGFADLQISTVDASQGSERPIVIIDTVRLGHTAGANDGLGFVNGDNRRFNVAMTGAQIGRITIVSKELIKVGRDGWPIQRGGPWVPLFAEARRNNAFISAAKFNDAALPPDMQQRFDEISTGYEKAGAQ